LCVPHKRKKGEETEGQKKNTPGFCPFHQKALGFRDDELFSGGPRSRSPPDRPFFVSFLHAPDRSTVVSLRNNDIGAREGTGQQLPGERLNHTITIVVILLTNV